MKFYEHTILEIDDATPFKELYDWLVRIVKIVSEENIFLFS